MKMIAILALWIAVSLLSVARPAFSEEGEDTNISAEKQKDECLLLARRCGTAAYSIQDRIEKLREEIEKGKRVYTVEELNVLKQKLEEVNKTLDYLQGM